MVITYDIDISFEIVTFRENGLNIFTIFNIINTHQQILVNSIFFYSEKMFFCNKGKIQMKSKKPHYEMNLFKPNQQINKKCKQ